MEEPVTPKLPEVPLEIPPKRKSALPYLIPGLLLSLIASFLVIYYNSLITKPSTDLVAPVIKPLFLSVSSPNGPATLINNQVLVSGYTLPNSTVLMFTDLDDASVDTDAKGYFEESLLIDEQGGPIQIIAYSPDGQEKEITMEVFTDSMVLGKTTAPGQVKKAQDQESTNTRTTGNANRPTNTPKPTSTPKPTKTQNAQVINAQAKKFLETSIQEKPIKKLSTAELRLALASESAGLGKNKNIKVATAEAVIATGGALLKRHAIQGIITGLSDGIITIAHQIQRDRINTIFYNIATVFSMKGIASPTGADLLIGMRIAAVGEPSESGLLAKRIHVIPGAATGIFKRFPVATGSGEATPSATPTEEATPSSTPEETPTDTPTETPTPEITP